MCTSLVYKFSCSQCASEILSTLGPPHVLYTRESLSMLEGVSELVLFCLFLLILWLGLTLSGVGVPVTLDDFRIIGSTYSAIDLRILESMHIFKSKHVLNDSQSSYPLSIVNI